MSSHLMEPISMCVCIHSIHIKSITKEKFILTEKDLYIMYKATCMTECHFFPLIYTSLENRVIFFICYYESTGIID